jgi:hypothetical protein
MDVGSNRRLPATEYYKYVGVWSALRSLHTPVAQLNYKSNALGSEGGIHTELSCKKQHLPSRVDAIHWNTKGFRDSFPQLPAEEYNALQLHRPLPTFGDKTPVWKQLASSMFVRELFRNNILVRIEHPPTKTLHTISDGHVPVPRLNNCLYLIGKSLLMPLTQKYSMSSICSSVDIICKDRAHRISNRSASVVMEFKVYHYDQCR